MDILSQNLPLIASLVALFVAALCAGFLLNLNKRVKVLFGGEGGELPQDIVRRLAKAEAKLEGIEPRLNLLEEISKVSVQKVGFLRFNPFQDTGGDNSFVLALLDRDNNGVLVSSLYMREGMRIYAKSIEQGKSKHALSEEEKKVLEETIRKNL